MNKQIIFILLIGVFLAGCTSKSASPTIFDNSVCAAPCWQNITPGVTTKRDALAILSKIDSGYNDQNQAGIGYEDQIQFTIYKGHDKYIAGWLYILNDRAFVMNFDFYAPYSGIRLDHAIKLFGTPESISAIHSSYTDQVTLINSSKGIALGYGLDGRQRLDTAGIEPETYISQLSFFDPNQYTYVSNSDVHLSGTFSSNNLHPWKGYGNFKDKYWPPATP